MNRYFFHKHRKLKKFLIFLGVALFFIVGFKLINFKDTVIDMHDEFLIDEFDYTILSEEDVLLAKDYRILLVPGVIEKLRDDQTGLSSSTLSEEYELDSYFQLTSSNVLITQDSLISDRINLHVEIEFSESTYIPPINHIYDILYSNNLITTVMLTTFDDYEIIDGPVIGEYNSSALFFYNRISTNGKDIPNIIHIVALN